jgi:hypothetical protein
MLINCIKMSSNLFFLMNYLFEKLIGNGIRVGSGFLFPRADSC